MSAAERGLGGRLSLFDPGALTTTQRELFEHITAAAAKRGKRSASPAPSGFKSLSQISSVLNHG